MQVNNGWKDLSDNYSVVALEAPNEDGICVGNSSLEF